jgi:glycyl-tRNA synthetase beta chain
VGNILKKTQSDISTEVDIRLLQESAENALYQVLTDILPETEKNYTAGNYTDSLQILAALKSPVDTFFDHVMVNVDDETLRNNRLALLAQLHQTMNRVADISKLAVN